jgi:hypothetical protein
MAKDLSDIVCELTGPGTARTMENLRRTLEDWYIKSTAQSATPEDQAAFTPELIARAHEAARWDNARTIVSWAQAIMTELKHAESQVGRIKQIQAYLATAKDKLAFYQRDPQMSASVIRDTEAEISQLTSRLRDLSQPAPAVPGHPPQARPRQVPSSDGDVAGDLSSLS